MKVYTKTKDLAHYTATGVGIEYFPERIIGALVDLYVLYLALTNTKIPETYEFKNEGRNTILAAWKSSGDGDSDNDNVTKMNEENVKKMNENAFVFIDSDKTSELIKNDSNLNESLLGDELTEDIKNYLASAWFYDLVRKKKYTKLIYQDKFTELQDQNKKVMMDASINDNTKRATFDKRNAKMFVLAQIKQINKAFESYRPEGRATSTVNAASSVVSSVAKSFRGSTGKSGGIRKTKKNKNSKKRRKNKTTRRKRNTKRNKR